MMQHLFVVFLLTLVCTANIYYPDDENGGFTQHQTQNKYLSALPAAPATSVNLTEIRGTSIYEEHVDNIISSGVLRLTLSVDKILTNTSTNSFDNIVYSPVSIAGALALILLGSNGKTFTEISNLMGLTTGVQDIETKSQIVHEQFGRMIRKLEVTSGFDLGRQVNFATAIFVQNDYPIRQVYKKTAEAIYKSEVLNVDFRSNPDNAQQLINAWVSERTSGKINNILSDSPSGATKVILASAMYFKAEWERPFFQGATNKRPFFPNGRKSKTHILVDMMSNGGYLPYYKDTELGCEILGFPYKGNQTTMYVLLPRESNMDRLKELEQQLTTTHIERLVSNVKYTGVVTIFPKMHIQSTIDLRKSLQLLGVKSLFNPAEANLALLSPGVGNNTSKAVSPIAAAALNPIVLDKKNNDILIFNRNGEVGNCSDILNPDSSVNTCQEENSTQTVTYKKFGEKVGRKITPRLTETVDNIRQYLNQHENAEKFENPGLYADNVIHKVFMDITETGTEAAAASTVSLSRDGSKVAVRLDVPFSFFIMHEETRTVLFWGSVNRPTPFFDSESQV